MLAGCIPINPMKFTPMNRWFNPSFSSQEMLGEWTQVASTRQYCPSQNDINRPLRMAPWHSWLV